MDKPNNAVGEALLAGVGGEKNVRSLTCCASRLRFEVSDLSAANIPALGQVEGAIQVITNDNNVQVVFGAKTDAAYKQVLAVAQTLGGKEAESQKPARRNFMSVFTDLVAGIIFPVVGIVAGAGVLKAVLIVLNTFGLLDSASGTYRIFYAAADGVLTYLPVFLGYTAAKKFGGTPFLGVAVACGLLSQDIAAAKTAGEAIYFFGLPVTLVTYTSNIMPIILACFVMAKVENALKKIIPDVVNFFVPMLTLAIVVPLTFVVIGPVMNWVGVGMADGYQYLVSLNPIVAGALLGFFWPVLIVFGIQRCFLPIVLNNIATLGADTLFVITAPNNFAMAGACLGVLLKTKNEKVKEIARPAAVTAILAGVTEPAIYGINLKYKRPFYIGMVFTGIGGALAAYSGVGIPTIIGSNILTLPAFLVNGVTPFLIFLAADVIAYVGACACTFLFGFNDSMVIDAPEDQDESAESPAA